MKSLFYLPSTIIALYYYFIATNDFEQPLYCLYNVQMSLRKDSGGCTCFLRLLDPEDCEFNC